jgi:hypothetical protein
VLVLLFLLCIVLSWQLQDPLLSDGYELGDYVFDSDVEYIGEVVEIRVHL